MLARLIRPAMACLAIAACQSFGGATFESLETQSADGPRIKVSGILKLPRGPGPFPAVVLLHTCGGVRTHVAHDWPAYLSDLGYATLTVDSYGPRAASSCNDLDRLRRFWGQAADAYGALEFLARQPSINARRVAVMGFSAGAIAINSFVMNGFVRPRHSDLDFRAAIALYGHCRRLVSATFPVLEIAAEHDAQHAPSCVAAARLSDNIETHVIKDAYHAFDQPDLGIRMDSGGSIMEYSARAVDEARALTKRFLATHLTE